LHLLLLGGGILGDLLVALDSGADNAGILLILEGLLAGLVGLPLVDGLHKNALVLEVVSYTNKRELGGKRKGGG
jgi:hypothetical protein